MDSDPLIGRGSRVIASPSPHVMDQRRRLEVTWPSRKVVNLPASKVSSLRPTGPLQACWCHTRPTMPHRRPPSNRQASNVSVIPKRGDRGLSNGIAP